MADGTDGLASDGSDDGGGDDADTGEGADTGEPELPFVPLPPEAALAKVKDFLTGLPPTAEEQQAYLDDPTVLRELVDGWMQTPEYAARELTIFDQLFQQHTSIDNLAEHLDINVNRVVAMDDRAEGRLLGNIASSFKMTVAGLVADGRPFTEVLTTREFMLDVPQMVTLAYLDATPRDDVNGKLDSWLLDKYPDLELTTKWTGTQVPIGQTVNPDSANFMTFWLSEAPTGSCVEDNNASYTGRPALVNAYQLLFRVAPGNVGCATGADVFTAEDFALRKITVRVAAPGEEPTVFFDLPTLRSAAELVVSSERVGYFTTLGFSANWMTNDSNQHRVNANQTLIVGLGRTFNPTDVFVPSDGATIDEGHADPSSPCYACHKGLDPLRDFLRQSYSYSGMGRLASEMDAIPGTAYFSLDGSEPVAGNGVVDLAAAMAGHDRFAPAWTEKLCTLVNAGACLEDDAELQRVAQVFADSSFDFRVLVRELVSSPVVTFAERTETWDSFGGVVLPVTQDRFCLRMSERLGITDLCNLEGNLEGQLDAGDDVPKRVRALADGVPPVAFGRSAVLPFVTTAPDVFSVASVERVCQIVSEQWYGSADGALWGPDDRELVLDHLVGEVIGIPTSDERSATLRAILSDHWDQALDSGATEVAALRSTFITACGSTPAASTSL
ncbi:MAG: hypothetical protein IAG13_16230 [Deltaproteobacteria bacterium]|nr:hypothetical protein [Nannocystaceae bacterium]